MDTQTYQEVLQEAERLSRAERLMLIERLIHKMRTAETERGAPPAWEDYAGSAPYPLCGEDAQDWVS